MDAPTGAYENEGHGKHEVAFDALNVLKLHAEDGAVSPVVAHAYPARQAVGADEPAGQNAPRGHAECVADVVAVGQ